MPTARPTTPGLRLDEGELRSMMASARTLTVPVHRCSRGPRDPRHRAAWTTRDDRCPNCPESRAKLPPYRYSLGFDGAYRQLGPALHAGHRGIRTCYDLFDARSFRRHLSRNGERSARAVAGIPAVMDPSLSFCEEFPNKHRKARHQRLAHERACVEWSGRLAACISGGLQGCAEVLGKLTNQVPRQLLDES